MNTKTYALVVPVRGYAEYWPEIVFLVVGALVPIAVRICVGGGESFERSGSITVIFAAIAEFIALNRLTKKHFLNACRAQAGETPWGLTPSFTVIGYAALVVGLYGTAIWGFGSRLL